MGHTDSATGLSPELVASPALRRAHDGGVAKAGGSLPRSRSSGLGVPDRAFDELINAGLLALANEDPYGLRRVSVTEVGRTRYAHLRGTRQRTGLWVPEPRFPITGPTAACCQLEHSGTGCWWSA
ncbi:MAG: hypothetical protein ACT4NP_08615 [Pseudonocardiales bacterium]